MLSTSKVARTFLFLLTIFQLSTFVSASARNLKARDPSINEASLLTNAARFAHGYGPLPPRAMSNPSRVQARDPQPSVQPVQPITGSIEVRNAGGLTMGYISKTLGPKGFGMASSVADKMIVTFTPNAPFSMLITSGGAYPFLGFDGGNLVSPIDEKKNFLISTNPTAPGSRPVNVGAVYGGKTESAIWSFSALSKQLTAQWVNTDFSKPNSRFWFYPGRHVIGLVDSNPLNSNAGQEVFLFLV